MPPKTAFPTRVQNAPENRSRRGCQVLRADRAIELFQLGAIAVIVATAHMRYDSLSCDLQYLDVR